MTNSNQFNHGLDRRLNIIDVTFHYYSQDYLGNPCAVINGFFCVIE